MVTSYNGLNGVSLQVRSHEYYLRLADAVEASGSHTGFVVLKIL